MLILPTIPCFLLSFSVFLFNVVKVKTMIETTKGKNSEVKLPFSLCIRFLTETWKSEVTNKLGITSLAQNIPILNKENLTSSGRADRDLIRVSDSAEPNSLKILHPSPFDTKALSTEMNSLPFFGVQFLFRLRIRRTYAPKPSRLFKLARKPIFRNL